ncbi:SPOR domain-containing protein [Pseudoxanthomonas mexicana]|uniref:SPOR domain-containing protein n=1 Tax=Pseudoxanthomonas mexicana TaxID=128785 RepID=UPI00398A90D9
MDTALKQRLIGAVVLIALAVIFLPMLVKGPAPDSGVSDVPLEVPAAPGGQYETRELPLVAPPGQPSGTGALGMPVATAPQAGEGDANEAVPANGAGPAAAAGNYAVSFGAYATVADAEAVIARLRQAQLPGYREEASINGRGAWRVRVGPYPDRAAAESARLEAVKVRDDVNAQVVVLDADAASPSASPAPAAVASAPATQPATPAATVTTQPLPASPPPAVAASSPPATKAAATTPPPAPATRTVSTAPRPGETAARPAPASTPPPAPSAPAARDVGFAVQLGAFANAADANALRDRVRAGGFSAFVEQVRTDKGTLNRVRVGPVASRAEAERLKAQVAGKFGIDGMVRPHP